MTGGPGRAAPLQPLPALYQVNFDVDELTSRRARVAAQLGPSTVALVPGAGATASSELFRQSNEFYHLTGLETPHSYLAIEGGTGACTLYMPHRDAEGERSGGRVLSAEDVELVTRTTGVDRVHGLERLSEDLARLALRHPTPTLAVPLQPAESPATSRDELLFAQARLAADPWDGRASRAAQFAALLRDRFPQLALSDLSPTLDRLREIKSTREIELLRYAGLTTALGVTQAMRSTAVGVTEYQLAAVARFEFQARGARGDGYRAIVGSGRNAWHGHYPRQASELRDGDLVLMDYAPDFAYYTSDIGRMWPANGTFSPAQRAVYEFILTYHRTVLRLIKPGADPESITDEAADVMRDVLDRTEFARPSHRAAALGALAFRGHLSHPVGMAVHDVGSYRHRPFEVGTVLSVDPMMWIEDEQQYVRVEDTVVVTEDGIENLTSAAPLDIDAVEAVMTEPGLPLPHVTHVHDERLPGER